MRPRPPPPPGFRSALVPLAVLWPFSQPPLSVPTNTAAHAPAAASAVVLAPPQPPTSALVASLQAAPALAPLASAPPLLKPERPLGQSAIPLPPLDRRLNHRNKCRCHGYRLHRCCYCRRCRLHRRYRRRGPLPPPAPAALPPPRPPSPTRVRNQDLPQSAAACHHRSDKPPREFQKSTSEPTRSP